MRIESSVTAISWIPSEAITGMPKIPFELGIGHYDEPPPDQLEKGDLELLRDADRFREANDLRAWIEVAHGRIVGHGYDGGGLVGSTTFRAGPKDVIVPGVAFETLQSEPEVQDQSVRFVQTVGGRAGFPAPRRVKAKPFIRIHSATAWTTLALTIHADGTSEHELVGASPFPRHWIYDHDGALVLKTGTVDFKTWYRTAHGKHTPWGDEESEAFVVEAESALERQLSRELMQHGAAPDRRELKAGDALVEQGAPGDELYLLLDGVVVVDVDGKELAEVGPGAILGERALLEGGTRTATMRARTRCRVGVFPAEEIDLAALEQLTASHRRETHIPEQPTR
ncbi:MAG: cyclic nucleotide-binding domain-containing protein [Frankiales bacterium]|nr:cyclic nucleotide-binding domain-containing protein [Frankiales bacterium]